MMIESNIGEILYHWINDDPDLNGYLSVISDQDTSHIVLGNINAHHGGICFTNGNIVKFYNGGMHRGRMLLPTNEAPELNISDPEFFEKLKKRLLRIIRLNEEL